MVTAVTSLGRSGLSDWLIQRFTAVVLGIYTVFIVAFILQNPDLTYEQWSGLFDHLWVRIFSLIVLLSTAAHAWIGLWAVLMDYVTTRMMGGKAFFLRITAFSIYAIVTLAYVVWGIEILWG